MYLNLYGNNSVGYYVTHNSLKSAFLLKSSTVAVDDQELEYIKTVKIEDVVPKKKWYNLFVSGPCLEYFDSEDAARDDVKDSFGNYVEDYLETRFIEVSDDI